MIKRINRTKEIFEQAQKVGKIKTLQLSTEQQNEWIVSMAALRRDFLYKQAMSERSAANCILYNNS